MKKHLLFGCAMVSLVAWSGVHAAAGRPLTISDLLTAVRVTEMQLSPDGRSVAFVRTTTNEQTGRRNADIWVVPADGAAAPRLLFGGESSELTPTWSPDSQRIAFVSTRGGSAQVWIAAAAGGEPRQVTKLAMGVQTPLLFSPDGTRVAFVSDVYPECPDEACNARRAEEAEKNPVKVHHVKRLLYPPLVGVAREHPSPRASSRRSTAARPSTSRPATSTRRRSSTKTTALAFSPDGKQIAFVSNREGNDVEAWTTNQDVWIVPVDRRCRAEAADDEQGGGCAAGVVAGWTEDRDCAVNGVPNFESDRWYLDVVRRRQRPAADGRSRRRISSVENFAFAPDGRTILFTAQDRGVVNVYSVAYPSGTPRVVTRGGAIVGARRRTRLRGRSARSTHDRRRPTSFACRSAATR